MKQYYIVEYHWVAILVPGEKEYWRIGRQVYARKWEAVKAAQYLWTNMNYRNIRVIKVTPNEEVKI